MWLQSVRDEADDDVRLPLEAFGDQVPGLPPNIVMSPKAPPPTYCYHWATFSQALIDKEEQKSIADSWRRMQLRRNGGNTAQERLDHLDAIMGWPRRKCLENDDQKDSKAKYP